MMIKNILLFISFIFFSQILLHSQNSSTFTRIGIGDMRYSYSARTLGMGHSGSALLNKDYVEILNPASWSSLTTTRIEFSFTYDGLTIANNTASHTAGDGDFKGFTFAFPVSADYGVGVALGVVPYTRMNYEVQQKFDEVASFSSPYTIKYSGKGGLSKIFLGGSYKLPVNFIFGATLDYYFGKLEYKSTSEFEETGNLSAEYDLSYANTGFGTTLGLVSPDLSGLFNSESISNFRLSVAGNIVGTLSTDTLLITRSASIIDTIGNGATEMEVPYRLITGAAITFSNKFTIALDYYFQPFTEYKFAGKKSSSLTDLHKFSAGFEYRAERVPGITYWEQIMLRGGLSYEQSQYVIDGTNINQYAVFAGFSLPLSPDNTIDFGFEYAIRGSKDNNLFQENFYKINLGISFGDLWFQRYEK